MEFHYSPQFLSNGIGSLVYRSRLVSDTLVVFVHGFTGKAVTTWDEFSQIMRQEKELERADICFYGYDSLEGQAFDQARELHQFLSQWIRSAQQRYKKILLVAHSLGAVISRYALIFAIDNNDFWKANTRLLLFAPAHSGTRIIRLLLQSLGGISAVFVSAGLYKIPVVDDLLPGSVALSRLEADTQRLRSNHEQQLTAIVIHALGDKVVHNSQFCYDVFCAESPVRDKTHSTICKPDHTYYRLPFDKVINVLRHAF